MGKAGWESASKPVWHMINRGGEGTGPHGRTESRLYDATPFGAVN